MTAEEIVRAVGVSPDSKIGLRLKDVVEQELLCRPRFSEAELAALRTGLRLLKFHHRAIAREHGDRYRQIWRREWLSGGSPPLSPDGIDLLYGRLGGQGYNWLR